MTALPSRVTGTGAPGQDGLYATAALSGNPAKEYIVKVVNTSDEARELTIDFKGLKKRRLGGEYRMITLSSPQGGDIDNVNGLEERIRPEEKIVKSDSHTSITTTIPPQTFAVIISGVE